MKSKNLFKLHNRILTFIFTLIITLSLIISIVPAVTLNGY